MRVRGVMLRISLGAGSRMPAIRDVVICVFRHRGRILVAQGHDGLTGERFFRPVGGGIEFGELAEDSIRREVMEELGLEIAEPVLLGVLENLFEFRRKPGHEIVFVFDARFVDASAYLRRELPISEPGWDGPARWLSLEEPSPFPIHPNGLVDLLRRSGGDSTGR